MKELSQERVNAIVVHCSATPPKLDVGVKEIRDRHTRECGWSDIGYHFVIRRDCTLEHGRSSKFQGAHVKGFNDCFVGSCVIGGVNKRGQEDSNFSFEQFQTLVELIQLLKLQYPIESVLGHRDLDSKKVCPCFDVGALVTQQH